MERCLSGQKKGVSSGMDGVGARLVSAFEDESELKEEQ